MKKLLSFICIVIAIIILLEPQTVTAGVKKGIELSIYSVIPALFPFMLLTNYMISHNLCQYISYFFYPFLSKLFHISKNGCFAVLIGFTGGYPMGAKTINDLYERNLISCSEGCYLSTFCNNCSLSFLINYVIYSCLNNQIVMDGIFPLDTKGFIALVYLPAICVGIINRFFFKKEIISDKSVSCLPKQSANQTSVIRSSTISILNLCIYVICFSVLVEFVNGFKINNIYKCIIVSLVEITSGCKYTATHFPSGDLQVFIILFVCIFGGLSITFQSLSQFKNKSFIKYYIIGKIETLVIFTVIFAILFLPC